MANKAPMTAQEAKANIAEMDAATPKAAMKRLLTLALGPLGNLSDDARAVYAARLAQL